MPSRTDHNQADIVAALRAAGCAVLPLHTLRHGAPDLAVGRAGVTYLLEVKSTRGELTEDERHFMETWRGHYAVVRSAEEALKAVGLLTLGE